MKSVLISIKPKWCELIASGKKTVEVRKTRPKLEVPFKCYIYCTDSKKDVFYRSVYSYDDVIYTPKHKCDFKKRLSQNGHCVYNGKVIGEFVCDRIDEIYQCNSGWVSENACMSKGEFFDYLGIPRETHMGYDKKAYAWHISDLVIYDEPKELSEFIKPCIYGEESDVSCLLCEKSGYSSDMYIGCFNIVTRPPQSWCYVEERS